jgi:biotin synthase
MEKIKLSNIVSKIEMGQGLSKEESLCVLTDQTIDTFDLVQAAWIFRKRYFGREVMVHVLNNVQNGLCPEDCRYCAQSTQSKAPIESYVMKSNNEILKEAAAACKSGAGRYCMVFSGTGPTDERVRALARLIREIKTLYSIEVCVSAGMVDKNQAQILKDAGLDRLNHNLNSSENFYPKICSTHSYTDRVATIQAAHEVGLDVCSGVIVGMGESPDDIFDMAATLRSVNVRSIPVNFLMSIPGIDLDVPAQLTPDFCLRVLCLFRFMNPKAEIRMAAGREIHLRSLEAVGLYVANSLFIQGYLNTKGTSDKRTLAMIKDGGFVLQSEIPLDELVEDNSLNDLKTHNDLRPFLEKESK